VKDCPAYGARNVQKVAAGTGEALPGRNRSLCPWNGGVLQPVRSQEVDGVSGGSRRLS